MFRTSLLYCMGLLLASGVIAGAQTSARPAEGVLRRVMPSLAPQFDLKLQPLKTGGDSFRISSTNGKIRVEGGTMPTLLYGVNWYLKYVAHLQVSTNGMQLGSADTVLPKPERPIEKAARYRWRYALNENADGYSAPYWDEARWRREIDVLALSGTNALLIERGTDLVLYQTFRDAGYSDEAIRRWITEPAHQNWQLMGNMCCFIEPISAELLQKRAESAKRLISMLRELGITPVLPGYYGIVPADFASLHKGAHVITQGDWNGFTRPGWIDPRDPNFALLADSFYRHQQELFGESSIYDMEIFQEGGAAGDVPVGDAAKRIQAALGKAHPRALWMMMGWQNNPMPAVIDAVDSSRVLVADIEQGRIPREDRDHEFKGAQWLYGGLWEFGGRTTLGAPLYDYAVRMPKMSRLPASHLVGTALFTEGLDTNPFAFDLYTEMAWHSDPVDLSVWTDEYAVRRYGGEDAHAKRAWQIILKTAYGYRADGNKDHGERDAAHDSLFCAQPSLTTVHAATWSPDLMRYRAEDLQPALTELLQIAPRLRATDTYKYDLVDLARQVMANESRNMLPQIKAAYESRDRDKFVDLTARWLHRMSLLDTLLQTNEYFLLGRWLQSVPAWASSPAELARLNYDARSILTTWGDRKASEFGLHEYANRDWAGLIADYYLPRWKMYFDSLTASLDSKSPPKPIDWYAFGDEWNRSSSTYDASPSGDSFAAALAIARDLHLEPQEKSDEATAKSRRCECLIPAFTRECATPHLQAAQCDTIEIDMSISDASPITLPADPEGQSVRFHFENSYARLPENFYARQNPTPVAAPRLVKVNDKLARHLRLDPDALASAQGVEILAGNRIAEGSEPLAMAYAGHQFGYFVPQLGDGRANLLGEVVGRDGVRYDIQLKGSGPTPFSRRGDGRAALGPVLREYIVSEAMAALGVPTTRALAAVTTGEGVLRETDLPGAVFTRVAASHLRVGTFQYFAAREDVESLRVLADYAIGRHYPEARQAKYPYRTFLDGVIARQASLIAQWMLLGFIHGVMNTDNTSISGETIDYGPCAFMEAYDPATIFSAIDVHGRYSYGNQPRIALWNLTCLAEAMLPILEQETGSEEAALASAKEALTGFQPQYEAAYTAGLRRKLGLFTVREGDAALAEQLMERMTANRADFTLTFRRLCDAAAGPAGDPSVRVLFADPGAYDEWAASWHKRLGEESNSTKERVASMCLANPAFIPRNHLVEAALDAAMGREDFQPFEQLLDVVSRPYEDRPELQRYATPARPEEYVSRTFCGT